MDLKQKFRIIWKRAFNSCSSQETRQLFVKYKREIEDALDRLEKLEDDLYKNKSKD